MELHYIASYSIVLHYIDDIMLGYILRCNLILCYITLDCYVSLHSITLHPSASYYLA